MAEHEPPGSPGASEIPDAPETPEPTDLWRRRLSPRQFLKLLGLGVASAAGGLAVGGRHAEADYTEDPGTLGYDQVDRELRVNGNLKVQGTVGIGTSAPGVGLDASGEVRVTAGRVLDDDGRATQCYYTGAAAAVQENLAPPGTWANVRIGTWERFVQSPATTWLQLQTMNGNWQSVSQYNWGHFGEPNFWSWSYLQTLP